MTTEQAYLNNQTQLEALGFETGNNSKSINKLSDSQKAVLSEQADQREKSIFELMEEIKLFADEINRIQDEIDNVRS